jgi:hypothetical protein
MIGLYVPFSAKSFNSSTGIGFGPDDVILVKSFNEFIYILPINVDDNSSEKGINEISYFVYCIYLLVFCVLNDHRISNPSDIV